MFNYYAHQKVAEFRVAEVARKAAEKARLDEAGVAQTRSVREQVAQALIAAAGRIDPDVSPADWVAGRRTRARAA